MEVEAVGEVEVEVLEKAAAEVEAEAEADVEAEVGRRLGGGGGSMPAEDAGDGLPPTPTDARMGRLLAGEAVGVWAGDASTRPDGAAAGIAAKPAACSSASLTRASKMDCDESATPTLYILERPAPFLRMPPR